MLRLIILTSICFLLSVILFFNSFIGSVKADYTIFFAGRIPYGKSLDDWAKVYWQWSVTTPSLGEIPKDPKTHLDACIVGSDPDELMIFLFNGYGEMYAARCTISSQKPILVPLLIGECDSSLEDDPRVKTGNIKDLWECAKDVDEEFYSWDVTLDDMILFKKSGNIKVNLDLKQEILVRNSTIFPLNFPIGNRYDVPAGSYPAVVDGYYLILKPLPSGEHILKYKITHKKDSPGPNLSYINGDVTYHFIVK